MPTPAPPADQLLPAFITVGFVGKRLLPGGEAHLRATLERELDKLEVEFPGPNHVLVGLSALALGADIVFAEIVGQRGQAGPVPGRPGYVQQVFLPEQPEGFFAPADFCFSPTEAPGSAAVQERVARARQCLAADAVLEVRITGQDRDRDERFAETAYEIVSACDLLLVACTQADQAAALGPVPGVGFARGGSAETLHHAHAIGKRALIIQVDGPPGPEGLLPVIVPPPRVPQAASAEAAPPAQLGFGTTAGLFRPGATAVPLASLHYPAVLRSIHERANTLAIATKGKFVGDNEKVLVGHLLATVVAALALVLGFHGGAAVLAGSIKVGLLAGVLLMAWQLHHRRQQTSWVEARLLTELTRAALALLPRSSPTGDDRNMPPLYPGGPHHLSDFYLPELELFAKSLYLLHLREFRMRTGKNHYDYGAHTPATAKEMAALYVAQRLDAPKKEGGQIAYFEEARLLAQRRLQRVSWWFFATSIAATVFALVALLLHPDELPHFMLAGTAFTQTQPGFYEPLVRLLVKFLPLALPVVAAGLIAWIGLRDLDREAERYADVKEYLCATREHLLESSTTAQLRRRIARLETTLLQELVEWRAKIKATHAG